jgi:3-oxoacyl-[acyl-carrier-protein] synthase-3
VDLERVGIRSRRTTLPLDYIRTTHNRDARAAAEATLYTHDDTGKRAAEMRSPAPASTSPRSAC